MVTLDRTRHFAVCVGPSDAEDDMVHACYFQDGIYFRPDGTAINQPEEEKPPVVEPTVGKKSKSKDPDIQGLV